MELYGKTHSSPHQLVELLKSRGLKIDNAENAERTLQQIGYYRFSAYLFPLLMLPKNKHVFKPEARFEQALDMYHFDRKLRILLFGAIARIEVAIRSMIVNVICEETQNPFWMTDVAYCYDVAVFEKTKLLIEHELARSREDFIVHFRREYANEYPPAWMLVELLPFGVLTKIYCNIKSNRARKRIAREFGLGEPVFRSWLTIITAARNGCCHHARMWNREFALKSLVQRKMSRPWIALPAHPKKLYYSLCIIRYFLNAIVPHNRMTEELQNLCAEFPAIDVAAMGFPVGWEAEALWSDA